MLKSKLIEAEEARRTGDSSSFEWFDFWVISLTNLTFNSSSLTLSSSGEPDKSYMAFLDLAHYFEQFPADEWLIDNFHSQCMSESLRVAGDGGTSIYRSYCRFIIYEKAMVAQASTFLHHYCIPVSSSFKSVSWFGVDQRWSKVTIV